MKKTVPFKQNLLGKIRNLRLNASDALFPLYEIVVNSIQSIHERAENLGVVDIRIIREHTNGLDFSGRDELKPIKSFVVVDNGVGFNDLNFDSFRTADTPYKLSLGCKGVGRFIALKAFEKIVIDSTYLDEKKLLLLNRSIVLSQKEGLAADEPAVSNMAEPVTEIRLENYLPNFQKAFSLTAIAKRLLDHCLIYFINNNAPSITIIDEYYGSSVNLSELFSTFIEQDEVIDYFELKNNEFEAFYIKKYSEKGKHQLHYCANDREVLKKPLCKIVPNLKERISDDRGPYYLSVYIKSPFLDDKVSTERNVFNIPESSSKKGIFDLISFEEIEYKIAEAINTNYAQELAAIARIKKVGLIDYIYNRDGLEYRHLMGHDELLDSIPPGLSDDRLDAELHKLNHKLEKQQKARINKFLASKSSVENHKEYQEELRELLKQEQDFSQSKLATYLTRRKIIIKVLDRFLGIQPNGDFVYEKEIHNIIFPRFNDSGTVSYKEHNLWVLDERLTYHHYISSDNPISSFTDGNSDKEPDLILFDKKFAFSEEDYSSVVIFEFKRPMRRLTGKDKDAHNQVISYISDLMQSNARDARNRYNKITVETPKFGFIICDYDKDFENYLIQFQDFNRTPKGTLFLYRKGINLMLEIMDYNTLLSDVDMRHKAFFKEMGIDRL